MHDLRPLLDNLDTARAKTAARNVEFDFDGLEALGKERRTALSRFETLRAEQKQASGGMKSLKPGSDEFNELRVSLKEMSDEIKVLDARRKEVEEELTDCAMRLPNLLDDRVPAGFSEENNTVVATVGMPRDLAFEPQDHIDLGEGLGVLDQEAARRVSGARFNFLLGKGARLERALINFMLDLHTEQHGYEEMLPPFLVNADAMTGTGQLPKFEEDLFKTQEGLYLIPTAEVPVTNYLREQLLPEYTGPIKYCAYTPCFRSEAGSHGRDTRGLIRQHQFDKVELVWFVKPEESEAAHEELTGHARRVLELLELPYRVMELCGGDVGFSAQRCYDLEVWLPSERKYREISSCSNFGEFQARRAGIRYRDENGKPQHFHTVNGSGLAVGRTWLAILENFQEADGSVTIPDALRPYTGFDKITKGS
ncbi:MAG: seryl-tRNA synthetase [Bradymonadia bacterium]|jgi:seryl-tRNA synthetase